MKSEVGKLNKLVDEISSLLMKRGSNKIDIKIRRNDIHSTITIIDYDTTYTLEEIEELNFILNIQRQCEVERFYWELMGEHKKGDELFLVGSMIDKANIEKLDNNLHIVIYRDFLCKSKY